MITEQDTWNDSSPKSPKIGWICLTAIRYYLNTKNSGNLPTGAESESIERLL